eukprot:CAMPEP_0179009884 /NCGR_PEP_ID=MMETSP0795-20121207/16510_1 /TAXON_ID=88552 /ORGANISM="Amoebophrya sp., Strain Ameob2" /LENGTH=1159 /DNA_ID=CAMNT_0020705111 /DNA_START=205 /DNA_END=3684 /DNA_ORIENTATION=+
MTQLRMREKEDDHHDMAGEDDGLIHKSPVLRKPKRPDFRTLFRQKEFCFCVIIGAISLLVFLLSYYGWRSHGSHQFDYVVPPERQPRVDERRYGYKLFPNGLRFLAIEDKESLKAGLAVLVNATDGGLANAVLGYGPNVNVGGPKPVQGLAHLLEHTVLIGSQKYPGKTDWDDFQEKFLGDSNAFTGEDRTVYYIGLVNSGMDECMDRQSDFIFRPSLSSADEMNAVEAEHAKNIQSPGWRINELKNYVFDPKGLGRFGTGNLHTLKTDTIAQDLKDFHKRYYYPAAMTMCTIGPDPIEKQLERASKYFGNEPNPKDPNLDPRPYVVEPVYGRYIHMFDENSPTPRLIMNFPIEMDFTPYYRSGVGSYLGHLLNFESARKKQGLQAELLDRGWIFGSGFDVGGGPYLSTLSFTAALRQPQYAEQVVNEFFKYIRVVRREIRMDVYESIQKLDNFYWDWRKDDGDRADLATGYAELLVENHPPEDLLMSGRMVMDVDFLRKMITMMVPERMTVLITEKNGAPDGSAKDGWDVKQLPFYKVDYTEGTWRTKYLKELLDKPFPADGSTDPDEYTLPPAVAPPPKIDRTPDDFTHAYTKEMPFGPSPERLDGTMWYRWGSISREPTFKFEIRFYSRLDRLYVNDPSFEKHAAYRSMWSRLLARKLVPILDEAESCKCVVDKDARYTNFMGINVQLGGFYSGACDDILHKVMDLFLNVGKDSVQVSLRGTEMVSRMVEALYLDLTDHTGTQPFKFALGGLSTVDGENDITTEALALTVKELRDAKLAEIGRQPLPEANGLVKVEDYLVKPGQPQPDHMSAPPPASPPSLPGITPVAKTDTLEDVDNLVTKILHEEELWVEGFAFGGITKDDTRRLRDIIVNKIEATRKDQFKKKIHWSGMPVKDGARVLKKPIDLQMHNKRQDDKNDVTAVRITKASKAARLEPDGRNALVSLREIFAHKLLGVMFSSFTFSRLRTLVLQQKGKQRYIVFGSVGANGGTSYDVDVLVQTTDENLTEVMQEIEEHIYKNFADFLAKDVDEKQFSTRKKSLAGKLLSKPDSFGAEYGHFSSAINALDGPPTECYWQLQKKKLQAVEALTLEEVRAAWAEFMDKDKTFRKQAVLYHDIDKPLDRKKTVAAYQTAKKNMENVDWFPNFNGYLECVGEP